MINVLAKNSLFGGYHITFIVISLVIIVAGSILSIKYLKGKTMERILLIIGIVSEALKVFSYILDNEAKLGGYLPKTDLPFHLCSIQIIFILILNFSKNEKLKHALRGFMIPTCLVGGIAAIALATSSSLNMPVVSVQYFGFHSAISAYAIYLLGQKEEEFTIKDFLTTIVMLVATLFIAIYINSILYIPKFEFDEISGQYVATEMMSINFMYVVNPPQDGLPILNKEHGWLVYMLNYCWVGIVVVALCYIKPIINFFKGLKKPVKKAK